MDFWHGKDMHGRTVVNEHGAANESICHIGKEPADRLLAQVNEYKAHKQAEIAKYHIEPDVMSHRGKYVVRNPDGQLEQVMGEVEKDYERPTLTPEQLKALKPRFMATVYEGQLKGLLSDMQHYPPYTFTALFLANG